MICLGKWEESIVKSKMGGTGCPKGWNIEKESSAKIGFNLSCGREVLYKPSLHQLYHSRNVIYIHQVSHCFLFSLSEPKEISKTRFWNTQISGELSNFLKIWLWNCVLALPSTEQEYCKVLLYKEFEYYEQRYPQGPRVRSMNVSQPGKIISESVFKKCASVWDNRRDNKDL